MTQKLPLRTDVCRSCGQAITYRSKKPKRFCGPACYMRFWRRVKGYVHVVGGGNRFCSITLVKTPQGTRVYGAVMLEKAIVKIKGPCEDWLIL